MDKKTKPVKAVVFDLDGTLYLSGRPYPKAVETVCRVASKVPVYYLSNNTSKSPVFYENRLKVMGLPLRDDAIISALYLSLDAIHEKGVKNVFFFANPEVTEWFAAQDPSLNLNPSITETELVLVAYHNCFDYRELCELSFRVQRGIPFWVTHTDFVCPDERGPVPDIGSFMALLKTAYGVEPERSFGKPNPAMLSGVLKKFEPEEILFVGDRLYTDFELAKRSGCRFALPLCGETKHSDLDKLEVKPECVVEMVSDIDFDSFFKGLV
ncbi:MAG: HAD hydrolase-like protein [Fibrobacteraceae bacterium]|nr:HAD hydrolase-like protein [Fibrobacteraceae bacterium]